MTRAYSVVMENQTIIADGTAVSVHVSTEGSVEFLRGWAGQDANATSAQEVLMIGSQASAFGTLTGAVPAPLDQGGPISQIVSGTAQAAGTSGTDASAEAAGAFVVLLQDAFNVLNGFLWVPTPKEVVIFPANSALATVLKFLGTPANLNNWHAGLNYGEL